MTSEAIYPGPEAAFEATHEGVTAKVWVSKMNIGSDPDSGPLATTRFIECEADVTLAGD